MFDPGFAGIYFISWLFCEEMWLVRFLAALKGLSAFS